MRHIVSRKEVILEKLRRPEGWFLADTLTPKERSERMSRVRGKGSKPEMKLRRLVHGMGFRYRLHSQVLPGKPDLVFPGRKAVIFMHGCFWHRHPGCKLARMPKSRIDFWRKKLDANRQRDLQNQTRLRNMGWRVLVVWECQLGDTSVMSRIVREFLNNQWGERGNDEIS